jgi:hypothetical protein
MMSTAGMGGVLQAGDRFWGDAAHLGFALDDAIELNCGVGVPVADFG